MSRTIEQGDLFFFYWQRVGTGQVDDLTDVPRFLLVLAPDGRRWYQRLVVGRKRLPDPRRHERFWAFAAEVADRRRELRDEIERRPTRRRRAASASNPKRDRLDAVSARA